MQKEGVRLPQDGQEMLNLLSLVTFPVAENAFLYNSPHLSAPSPSDALQLVSAARLHGEGVRRIFLGKVGLGFLR